MCNIHHALIMVNSALRLFHYRICSGVGNALACGLATAAKDFAMAPDAITCPSCEFIHGTPGKAMACENGLMRCESCGGSWREMGTASTPLPPTAHEGSTITPAGPRAQIIAPQEPSAGREGKISGDGVLWLAAGVAAFCLLAQPFWLIGQWDRVGGQLAALEWANPWSGENVQISMLSARQLEREGRIAVRIEGRIVNTTSKRQRLGDVDIVLSQSQGHRVYSWKHRPSVPYLEPGQSLRFSTANGEVPEAASSVEIRSSGAQTVARL
jgi:hypothetical protein